MSIRPRPRPRVGDSDAAAVAAARAKDPLRSLTVRTYVVSCSTEQFVEYMRQTGKKLQDCKSLTMPEQCRGIDFTSPLNELVVLNEWWRKGESEWNDEVCRLVARYCRDKRVHEAPRYET